MNRAELVALSLQGLLAWLVLSTLGWYFGEALGATFIAGDWLYHQPALPRLFVLAYNDP
jgi:hypothetical protein